MQALGNRRIVRLTRRARGGVGSLSVALLLVGTAAAQWTKLTPTTSPSPRTDAAIAYDAGRQTTFLFGGFPGNSETHAWNGRTWQLVASSGPPAVWASAMAYEAAASGLLLFGGKTATAPIGDTWRFNGTQWTRLFPTASPSARYFHALARDVNRGRLVLFGGQTGAAAYLGDTWEWDGANWTQRAATGPSPRAGHRMAWDPHTGRVLLFGGQDASGFPLDTWAWNGTSWTQVASGGPGAVERPSMDTIGSDVVLFEATGRTSDLWTWSGSAWVRGQSYVAPSARGGEAMAASANGAILFGGYLLLFGHYGDTWHLNAPGSRATVPASALASEGNAALPLGSVARRRMQTVYDPAAFPAGLRSGLLRSAQLRRDGGGAFLLRDVDLLVSIGAAATPPSRMSTTFLANYAGTPTNVFQGTISVAASQALTPEPFDIVLPFAVPFAWGGQNLALEVEVLGTNLPTAYGLDAVQSPHLGLVTGVGQACAGSMGTPSLSLPSAGQLVTGGMIDIGVTAARPGAIAFSFLGDSSTQWAGIPLPLQWPGTNCFVYHNWVVNQSSVVAANGTASAIYPIPAQRHLVGTVLFSQWGIYEGIAGTPPLVTTGMARMTIGPIPDLWDTITNADGSAVGAKAPGVWQTPVVQFGLN